jgi:NAD(P)-dependent dehydrogenase (short-subunit alcohol dehydrogenase family)
MREVAKDWDASHIGDLSGNNAVVTGANSGIGFHTALELGRHGARVVVACRNPERGQEALAKLRAEAPQAEFTLEALDLSSLASVRAFAERLNARGEALDLLVNNAGVMALPTREVTTDGFERQLGTNHLGHFALTGQLVPLLAKSKAPRVVTVSSGVAYYGGVDLSDLQLAKRYSPFRAYIASKAANLYFMRELGRRAPWITSVAAHPGATYSNLQKHTQGLGMGMMMSIFAQQADRGALPSLYAATCDVRSGEFYGPRNRFHMQGPPVEVRLPKRILDDATAVALWVASEELTSVRYRLDESVRRTA